MLIERKTVTGIQTVSVGTEKLTHLGDTSGILSLMRCETTRKALPVGNCCSKSEIFWWRFFV